MFDVGHYQSEQSNRPESDRGVTFLYEAVKQEDGTFKNVEYFHHFLSKNEIVHRVATDEDRARFRAKYEAFKQGQEIPEEGFPISEWSIASRADVANCREAKIYTVEQLAEAPDPILQKYRMVALKYKARDFLESNKDSGLISKMRSEIEDLKSQVKALERQKVEIIRNVQSSNDS